MKTINDLLTYKPYGLSIKEKEPVFFQIINDLNNHHIKNCTKYKKFFKAFNNSQIKSIEDFPFLPVSAFKQNKLKSVDDGQIIKLVTSSGTTGQVPSSIYLDDITSNRQTKVLSIIIKDFIGEERLPMMFADTKNVFKSKETFSARGAGILGLANFGKDHFYLLDENMNINYDGLNEFIKKYEHSKVLIFGFTYLVWQFLYKALREKGIKVNFSNGILIHSGGWKKIQDEKVDDQIFKNKLKEQIGIKDIYNFYGMIEQTGSVFMECEHGFLHSSIFSDILIRNSNDWSICKNNQIGVIETLSLLPYSYPGHILLTEDLGYIVGKDDCKCKRKGKYFKVLGRVPKAELRGCSDTTAI